MGKMEKTKANKCDCFIIIFFPVLLGIVAGIGSNLYLKKIEYVVMLEAGMELLGSMIDVWGILLGFIIAAVSVLMTIGENSYIKNLVETNHMSNIILSYVVASTILFISLVYMIILLIIKKWTLVLFAIFFGVNVSIVISVGICVYLLFGIAISMNR